jgi:hypothetical protein
MARVLGGERSEIAMGLCRIAVNVGALMDQPVVTAQLRPLRGAYSRDRPANGDATFRASDADGQLLTSARKLKHGLRVMSVSNLVSYIVSRVTSRGQGWPSTACVVETPHHARGRQSSALRPLTISVYEFGERFNALSKSRIHGSSPSPSSHRHSA